MYGTLIACIIAGLPLPASPVEDKVNAFKKAIKDEIVAEPAKDEPTPATKPVMAAYADTGALMASLDQIPAQMDSPNNMRNVEIQIGQIMTAYSFPQVQKTGKDLLDEIHQEHKARQDAVMATILALRKQVSDEVGTAKTTADLDSVLVDLQKFLNDRYGFNSENQAGVSGDFRYPRIREALAKLSFPLSFRRGPTRHQRSAGD